jgi:hypothetical protein
LTHHLSAHHGRVVKLTGDVSIIEFRSVVDAARCPVEVQTAMIERNAGVPPAKRIEFRVFAFKGKNADAREIGKALGVRYMLEGSVQRYQNRVRVNAHLIDAETGGHLWAERFDEPLADLFDLQDELDP